MNPSPEAQAVPQSLRILGISRIEEAIYRRLLRAPGSTAEMLAASLNIPAAELSAAVAALERQGFVTFAPEREPRLFPSPPDIAIESLLLRRQTELQLARLAIAELQREQINMPDGNPVVEIIDADPAAQAQPYDSESQPRGQGGAVPDPAALPCVGAEQG